MQSSTGAVKAPFRRRRLLLLLLLLLLAEVAMLGVLWLGRTRDSNYVSALGIG